MEENVVNREFLGQGWAFPLQIDPRGGFALARGPRDIEQAIRIVLETMPGERVMRPEFGCRVKELLFAPRNASTRGELIAVVKAALVRWEPRIEVQAVGVIEDPSHDGAWLVEIGYTIKDTHDVRSIVYPFFIIDEEAK